MLFMASKGLGDDFPRPAESLEVTEDLTAWAAEAGADELFRSLSSTCRDGGDGAHIRDLNRIDRIRKPWKKKDQLTLYIHT